MQLLGPLLLVIASLGQVSDFRRAMAELPPFELPTSADLVLVSRLELALKAATETPEREKLLSHLAAARVKLAELGDDGTVTYAQAALDDLTHIEARYKSDPQFHHCRIQAKYWMGRGGGDVHPELERLIKQFPKSADLRRFEGELSLREHNLEKVESIYRAVSEIEPNDGAARIVRGYALFHLNDRERALSELKQGLAYSDRRRARLDLACLAMSGLRLEEGDSKRAENLARLALEHAKGKDIVPASVAFWIVLANTERPHSALEFCTENLIDDPTNARLLALKAISQLNLARPELALKFAEAGFKSDSKAFLTCWALGRTLAANGHYVRAVGALRDAEAAGDRALYTRQMWDCQLRRALLTASAADAAARNGDEALRLSGILGQQSLAPENQRLAAAVRACAHAELDDFASALRLVRASQGATRDAEELATLARLETRFTKREPNRISAKDAGAIRFPPSGFISGRLKPLVAAAPGAAPKQPTSPGR